MLYYGFMLLFGQHCLQHHGAASNHHATTLGHALAPETLGHALELAKNIGKVERLHSQARRMSKPGTQGHATDVRTLDGEWVIRGGVERLDRAGQIAKRREPEENKQVAS